MDADDKLHHHQSSSSFIKQQQSNTKFIIKFGRNIIHQQQQQQQQCKEAAEEEVEVEVMKKKKNMSVSKHNLLSISNTTSPNSISNNSDSSLSPTTCSICGKLFPSKQSLFGHMRSHPEREWRGIQPPPPPPPSPLDQSQSVSVSMFIEKYNNSHASTDSDDSRKSVESYQGVGPLPINWSNTGKRGRRSSYGLFISSDERIDDAVKGLLMLKEGNDLDVALMNKQISRETEGITMKKRKKKKKRMILESSSSSEEEVSRSSDLLRSSKKIKIDQERSCGNSRDGFDPKLVSSNIQSTQLEQLPPAAASNMFQEDCGLVKNVSKKVKLADERISCDSSSRDVLMNSIPEQLPQVDFSLLKNSSKKLKLDDDESRGCSTSSMFDPSHLQQMYSNGFHRDVFDSKLFNSSIPSSSPLEQIPPTPIGYFQQGGFNSVFQKPAILMKATATATAKKKVKENEKGSSAADQNMGMQVSCYEFKCDTCNRTFPSHQALGGHKSSQRNCKSSSNISYPFDHHHHLQCRESMLAVEQDHYITETKIPTSYTDTTTTHRCEHCQATFPTGQALGGHKRKHYTGGLNTSAATVHVNSMTMAQTDHLMAQTEKLIKKEELNRLSVVPVASSSVISTSTVTNTENKPPVLDFDLNEIDLNETPDDDQSWK